MKAKKIIAIYLRLSSEDKDEDKDESNSITRDFYCTVLFENFHLMNMKLSNM